MQYRQFSYLLLTAVAGKGLLGALSYLANPQITFPSPQLLGRAVDTVLPPEIALLKLLVFAATGILLLIVGRQNRSAFFLGGTFLTIASPAADHFLRALSGFEDSIFSRFLLFLSGLPFEVLAPFFLWSFVREFPEAKISFSAQRFFDLVPRVAAIVAAALLIANIAFAIGQHFLDVELASVQGFIKSSTVVTTTVLVLAAIAGLLFRTRHAVGLERRRGTLFIVTLIGVGGPVALAMLVNQSPEILRDGAVGHAVRMVSHGLLLALPLAATYSILGNRVLEIRLMARKVLHHLLSRWTGRLLLGLPLLFLVVFLFRHRDETLVELFAGWNLLLMLAVAGSCGAALIYQRQILEGIDRRFFRERYNARRILSQLVYQIRRSRTIEELANLVCRGIDLAFHLESAALMISDGQLGQLSDPRGKIRALDLGSQLATWLHGQKDALEIDLADVDSALESLPLNDRHWLVDGKIQVLVPLFSSDGSLLAVLALGPKKSELPFLREDFHLLTAIASSSALAIELLRLKHDTDSKQAPRQPALSTRDETMDSSTAQQATECRACDRVYKFDVTRCPKCKVAVENALIPYVLHNVFRFEERIGTGGMAVVYRATDLKLGRTVAIKTLPRVSPEAAIRLQKEARTAATVSHIGLAAVYGLETWKGTPMLILELLEGGTLSDRLSEQGPLTPLEVVDTGQTVALALERIHSVGILHRDIKPSNIGYTKDGAAKLLDFGIARIHRDLRRDRAVQPVSEDSLGIDTDSWQEIRTSAGRIAGTLPYLSPEVVQGEAPSPFLDLWSLSVVLYEALIGENLFAGQRLGLIQLLERLRHAQLPDIATRRPDCPAPLVEFFRLALHPEKATRPQGGRELYDLLSDVRRTIER